MSKQQIKTLRRDAKRIANAPQRVRILAGQWRGATLPVLLHEDIRPTPVRVRETLFNWLQGYIVGSDCLDLYAGSGALGFESVSRGARSAQLVDQDLQVTELLKQQAEKLHTQIIKIIHQDAQEFLCATNSVFDIIFIDPPFTKLHPFQLLETIQKKQLLKPNGVVYVEYSSKHEPLDLPQDWQWRRQSKAGEVEYGLVADNSS